MATGGPSIESFNLTLGRTDASVPDNYVLLPSAYYTNVPNYERWREVCVCVSNCLLLYIMLLCIRLQLIVAFLWSAAALESPLSNIHQRIKRHFA